MTLDLAPGLKIPLDGVTQRYAFMGRSGSGKTYAAGKLAEEMLDAGQQVVVLDPVGNWYGLRISADGKGKGYSIPVLGGSQGDIPLEPSGGALVANTIVERNTSAVVDVSMFRKGERQRFVADFAEQLFHRKKSARTPMHLIVEEAHVFVPQRTTHGQERLLGAMEDLVRLGRNFGIGVSLLSQRPQSVNKDALNQTEVLLVFQLTGPQERDAVEGWIEGHGMEVKKGQDHVRELPRLPVGECFIWSPQFLDVLDRFKIGKKKTYDASATPDQSSRGAASPVRPLGQADLEALRGAMAEVVKRAEADDPNLLRRQIVELRRELMKAQAAKPPAEAKAPKRVEVPVLSDAAVARIEAAGEAVRKAVADYQDRVVKAATELRAIIERVRAGTALPAAAAAPFRVTAQEARAAAVRSLPQRQSVPEPETLIAAGIVGGARRMLLVLAAFRDGRTARQLATLSGLSARSGTFSDYLGRLRKAGLIESYGERLRLTDAGVHAAGGTHSPPTPQEVRDYWIPKMVGGSRRMLLHLLQIHPGGTTREGLAEASGISVGSGTYSDYLGRLRGNDLIEERDGLIFASEELT